MKTPRMAWRGAAHRKMFLSRMCSGQRLSLPNATAMQPAAAAALSVKINFVNFPALSCFPG